MKNKLLMLTVALMTLAPLTASAYWGPVWRPYHYGYYYGYPLGGEVKVDTKVKNAEVFLDGAFAGTTHEARSMRLRPGRYNVEIREAGVTSTCRRSTSWLARRCTCVPSCDDGWREL